MAHHRGCDLIQDPTRGPTARGPVPAGAITTGPEQQVSPALDGHGHGGGYSPEDLRSAYGLPPSGGAGETVAVVDAYNDPSAESDLSQYRSEYKLAACTAAGSCLRQVNQAGGSNLPEANERWAAEISTDLDMVSAACPACHILLVEAQNEQPASLAAAEDEAVKLGATEISNSYGEPVAEIEPSLRPDYEHPGIPITVAAGDEGYGVESPASSPNVIAVGGTTLQKLSERSPWSEAAWSGTGSGCSAEAKPAWQTDTGCTERTNNDVAAVANPNTPVSVYDSYQPAKKEPSPWLLEGGTSVATPIVAAAMALSDSYTRSFDGAQALYMAYANNVAEFNDIVEGSNELGCDKSYLCEALPGYDGPTGLGSLHGVPEVPAPVAVTEGATSVEQSTATLAGSVNPHAAQLQECAFEYGPTTAYGSSVACSSLPAAGTNAVPVSAVLSRLTPGVTYHYRVALRYPGGAGEGSDASFSTPPGAPSALTQEASAVTASSVSLAAQLAPNGEAIGTCTFEYGSTDLYGSQTLCTFSSASPSARVSATAAIAGLRPGSIYHFRVVASNSFGTGYGGDEVFRTTPGRPAVATDAATHVGSTSAQLNGTIETEGEPISSCGFEFDGPGGYAPCAQLPGATVGSAAVFASVSGLSASTRLEYRLVASDAAGASLGAIQAFTTGALEAPGSQALAGAVLVGAKLSVRPHGMLVARVRCTAAEGHCAGTLTLQTLGSGGTHRGRPKPLRLGSAAFTIAAGHVRDVSVHLSAAARRLLARSGVLRARAIVLTRSAPGSTRTQQSQVILRSVR